MDLTEPILDCLTSDDIAQAMKEYVLRRAGLDPAQLRTVAKVSWPRNVPPPAGAAVYLEQAPPVPLPPPPDGAEKRRAVTP